MAAQMKLKLIASIVLACMVLNAPYAQAGVSCGDVVSKMAPCSIYLVSGGAVPAACCNGLISLGAEATTPKDRQAICSCLKTAAAGVSGIQPALAMSLPSKCGLSIPYKLSPTADCSKVR